MPSALCSFGHAPSGSCCQAAAGISEHSRKFNPSSCVDWLNASSKSAAPSAPFVSLSKHLQCFVRINLLKRCWEGDKSWYTITHPGQLQLIIDNFTNLTMLLNTNNFQQRQIHTGIKQENLQPFLSARHPEKFAFFKLSHLALRTFCQAPVGI